MKRAARLVFVALVAGATGLSGQTAECPEWVTPPGGSNPEDRAPHRCSLQAQPSLSGHLMSLPAPRFERRGGVHVTVFILEDGSVDPEFTRLLSGSGNWDFWDRFLESLRRIRLSETELRGVSRRFGFELVVETGTRSDSIPEELHWDYRQGPLSDTIIGRWVPSSPEPAYSSAERSAVLGRVTDQLIAMRVVTPERAWNYCVLVPERDSVSVEVIRERLRGANHWPAQNAKDCHLDVGSRRLIFSSPVRTGQGRTVVTVSGDHLESWPPGFDGRFFPSWKAHCALLDQGDDKVHCSISAVYTDVRELDRFERPEPAWRERAPGWPLQFQLLVHGADLYLTDTIAGQAEEIPHAPDLPVYHDGRARCTASGSAGAASQWDPDGEKLVRIELDPPTEHRAAHVGLVSVFRRRSTSPHVTAACGEQVDQPFAVTSLEGVGPPLRGPVDLCLDFSCSETVEVPLHDPLAPALRFPFTDLRPGARDTRGFLMFKLETEGSLGGLIPILALGAGADLVLTVMSEYADGSYRMGVNRTPSLPPDSEVRLYLVRR